jgi:hypothetical protein
MPTVPDIKYAVFALCLLAACDQTPAIAPQPDLPADDPRQAQLIAAECAIYFAAVTKLEAQGTDVSGNPTRGCPPEAAAVSQDINPMVSFPPMMSGYPQILYQRIVARGIPVATADEIAQSKAFWDLVAKRDSLLAGF